MTDPELDPPFLGEFDSLNPRPERIDAMESAIVAAFAVMHRSLTAEWLILLRTSPVANSALVLAAAFALLLVTTPVVGLFALLPFV